MSSNPSQTTDAICLRIPKEVFTILERKARKQGVKPSEWLKRRVIYDVSRKHKSQKNNIKEG